MKTVPLAGAPARFPDPPRTCSTTVKVLVLTGSGVGVIFMPTDQLPLGAVPAGNVTELVPMMTPFGVSLVLIE